ncbi:hypothetical protein J6590_034087 [Homalodisca vitripennis]|nr:hypothetical protein J6590_034087 [Homalodisca vitripennis]
MRKVETGTTVFTKEQEDNPSELNRIPTQIPRTTRDDDVEVPRCPFVNKVIHVTELYREVTGGTNRGVDTPPYISVSHHVSRVRGSVSPCHRSGHRQHTDTTTRPPPATAAPLRSLFMDWTKGQIVWPLLKSWIRLSIARSARGQWTLRTVYRQA